MVSLRHWTLSLWAQWQQRTYLIGIQRSLSTGYLNPIFHTEVNLFNWLLSVVGSFCFCLLIILMFLLRVPRISSSQSGVPGPTASASPGNFLEMQILKALQILHLCNQKPWGVGPSNLCFSYTPGSFWCALKFENHCLTGSYSLRMALKLFSIWKRKRVWKWQKFN